MPDIQVFNPDLVRKPQGIDKFAQKCQSMTLINKLLLPLVMGTKLTEAQRIASNAETEALVNEYNLIQAKGSSLSRSQRDAVERRIRYLSTKGKIILENNFASLTIETENLSYPRS